MLGAERELIADAEAIAKKHGYFSYKEFLQDTHFQHYTKDVNGYLAYLKMRQEQDKTYLYMRENFQFF